MGHRILNHRSVCRGLHGHRYKAEITVTGSIVNESGVSEEGMVMDFADIKKIALEEIHEKLDHGFMVWNQDDDLLSYFKSSKGHKAVIVPFTPTAENVVRYIFGKIRTRFKDHFGTGLRLDSIKLWETPSSYVKFNGQD